MVYVYPIILTPDDRGYVVSVPDLNINTEGDNLADAIAMARDAIGLWGICEEDDGREIPAPSTTVPEHDANELTSWVDIDFQQYRRAHDMTTMRINVSIPQYLKVLGDKVGINYSQELQARLKEKFHVSL